MVLWMLVLISFLVSQYLGHNREKADIAANAWSAFRQRQAVSSVVQLFATDVWPLLDGTGNRGQWFRLFPDDLDVWVRVDNESVRVNVNKANDGEIKQKIAMIMGDNLQREADTLSDAILDWRDPNHVGTRMHGVGENDYKASGLPYRPANGPFNVMPELLLVLGMKPEWYWGDPLRMVESDLRRRYDQTQGARLPDSLSDLFTIYSAQTKRVSLVVPGNQNGYLYENIFLARQAGQMQLQIVGSQQVLGVAPDGFDGLIDLESQVSRMEAKNKGSL